MAFRPWTVNNLDMALAKTTVKKLKQALELTSSILLMLLLSPKNPYRICTESSF